MLIVEDDERMVEAYRAIIQTTDWLISVAQNMHEAESALTLPGIFDLVILDIGLPNGNGLDLIEKVKSAGAFCLITTGRTTAELIEKSGDKLHMLENVSVLTKPVSFDEFRRALEIIHERKRKSIG